MRRPVLGLVLLLAACGGEPAQAPAPPAPRPSAPPVASAAPAAQDPLGPRPDVPPPAKFTPPIPASYKHSSGVTVWLLERHTLPIVSMQIAMGVGAASDPKGKAGLASITAGMLDEGAGSRDALAIARDLDRLGATLATGAYGDYSFAHLTVLKKNLAAASAIFGDVVVRPTFSPVEWQRVSNLWKNDLRQRQSDPNAVAAVVTQVQLFGPSHPYGHPTTGTTKSAAAIGLDDVKAFYKRTWRPDAATLVVVGDVTRAELDPVLDQALSGWKPPATGLGAPGAPQLASGKKPGRRVVVVDRPDAPQSVIAVTCLGVAAGNPQTAPLTRVNAALGGSFTSRLNQDLREEHGWSYGAKSRFSWNAMPGMFVAQAAVHTEHTGEALKAMIADVEGLAQKGLTDEEVDKTRLLARSDLVESYETVEAAVSRLARNAGVGLPPDHDATASVRVQSATKEELAKLAATHLGLGEAVVVVVGPRAKLEPQLEAIGIDSFETVGPEGQ